MNRRAAQIVFGCLFAVGFALPAYANAGTPLMFASAFHLLVGNIVLGLIEGGILILLFRVRVLPALIAMILANYASMWAGFGFMPNNDLNLTIENIEATLKNIVITTFFVTLVVEYPFVLFSIRKIKRRFIWSIVATLLIHGVTYSIIVRYYEGAGDLSMVQELEIVDPGEMTVDAGYALVYFDDGSNDVLLTQLDDLQTGRIATFKTCDVYERLYLKKNDHKSFDLLATCDHEEASEYGRHVILRDFRNCESTAFADVERGKNEGTYWRFGEVGDLGIDSNWNFSVGFWDFQAITCYNDELPEPLEFAVATTISDWMLRNAVHIAGDHVVFQLGDDQICIMQPQEKKIALLARGRGLLVMQHVEPSGDDGAELPTAAEDH